MSVVSTDSRPNTGSGSSSYFETYPRKKTKARAGSDTPFPQSTRTTVHAEQTHSTPIPSSSYPTRHHPRTRPQPPRLRPPSPDMDPPSDPRTPGLRYSGSSSATHHLDTPPRTPPSTLNISIVAAPIPDVGTMDALVDGMNGFDRDDIFYASSLHRSEHLAGTKRTSNAPTRHRPSSASRANHPHSTPSSPHKPIGQTVPSRIPRPKPKKQDHTPNCQVFPKKEINQHQQESDSISPTQKPTRTKAIIPTIDDIVKAHTVTLTPSTSSKSISALDSRDSIDLISRSSIDTIAEEVQHTLRQPIPEPVMARGSASSLAAVDNPKLDSTPSYDFLQIPPETSPSEVSQSEAIATYIRSARLTTLIKLPRPLRAPLQVSVSDLGDTNGRPLLVFLGLGAVRYIMGLYDEMAEILGLRIITIDRWGLGRTSQDPPNLKGVKEWGRVVNDVLDRMGIQHCSILAHSAGAPYAMSFANLYPERVKGDVCLLAPWVGGGESSGYRWLKYVPNGLLKTAHAAEWRLQTWMLGKPPSMNYQGIGYTKWDPAKPNIPNRPQQGPPTSYFDQPVRPQRKPSSKSSITKSDQSSVASHDYDDLADFEGRFESRSTLTTIPPSPVAPSGWPSETGSRKRRSSRGIFQALLPLSSGSRRDSTDSRPSSSKTSLPGTKPHRLKSLHSIGSLRSSSKSTVAPSSQSNIEIPILPPIGLGFGGLEWPRLESSSTPPVLTCEPASLPRSRSRRSISLTTQSSSCKSTPLQHHSKSQPDVNSPHRADRAGGTIGYQASLANALIAASHAEASKGVHSDLLQILNHEGKSWGFSYNSYPHKLRVWYGDKDERIAEGAVRWMERTIGSEGCDVKVIKNADHSLMYRTEVIVEVMELVRSFWS